MADQVFALLDSRIRSALRDDPQISRLNEVQRAAIPPVLEGDNVLLLAGTAGGKTEAALWPLLTRAGSKPLRPGVRLLMLAPLKALLNNLEARARRWAECVDLAAFKWHGDVARGTKLLERAKPSGVLLTTPESLEVIVSLQHATADFFHQLDAVVIDEAHYFADSPRGAQIAHLVERISAATGRDIQRVGLSATVGNPERIARWLAGSSSRPCRPIRIEGDRRPARIEIHLHKHEAETERLLIETCGGRKVIVFAPSRREAEALSQVFIDHRKRSQRDEIPYHVHHSSIAKQWREDAERQIRLAGDDGRRTIISTSTLELGIDIGHLDDTVQVGPPHSVSSFVQRLGRTGRRPQTVPSTRLILDVDENDDEVTTTRLLIALATSRLAAAHRVEDIEPSTSNFALLAQQILCLSLECHGIRRDDAFARLRRADPASSVQPDELSTLVEHLLGSQILRTEGDLLLLGPVGEARFGRKHFTELVAVFDAPRSYTVKHGAQEIGTLDLAFAAGKKLPFVITLAGMLWEVVKRDDVRRCILVQPSSSARPPSWHSRRPPFEISRLVAQEIGRIVRELPDVDLGSIRLNVEASAWLRRLADVCDWPRVPERAFAANSTSDRTAILWTYFGDRDNWLLGRYLEAVGGLKSVDSDFRSVTVAHAGESTTRCEHMAREAIAAIPRTSASSAGELSLQFARDLPRFHLTKYDDLVPDHLRTIEHARGLASFEHLRRAFEAPDGNC